MRADENLLFVRGAVPGARGGTSLIRKRRSGGPRRRSRGSRVMAESKAAADHAPVVTQAKADGGTIELPATIFGEPLAPRPPPRRRCACRRPVAAPAPRRPRSAATCAAVARSRGSRRAPAARAPAARVRRSGRAARSSSDRSRATTPTACRSSARRTALRSVLAQKLREERLTIVDRIEFAETKTKHFVAMLARARHRRQRAGRHRRRRRRASSAPAATCPTPRCCASPA